MGNRTSRLWFVVSLALVGALLSNCPALRAADAGPEDQIGQHIKALGSKDYRTRAQASKALIQIGQPAVKPLIAALGSADAAIRGGAASGLGAMASGNAKDRPNLADAIGPLVALLGDKDYHTHSSAGYALRAIGPPAIEALIDALGSRTPGIRAGAAGVIRQMHEGTWQHSRHKDAAALRAALDKAIAPLSGLTKDVSPDVRAAAYSALAYIDEKRREAILTTALRDTDATVRAHACAAAASLRQRTIWTPQGHRPVWPDQTVDRQLIDALIACLNRGGEEQQHAARALGRMGDRRAVEPLIAATKRGSESSRGAAIQALGQLGGPQALAALKAMLKDPNWVVRIYSLQGLAEAPGPEALEALLPMLTHTSRQAHETSQIREAATEALWKMARTPAGGKAVLARINQVREALGKQLAMSSGDVVFSTGLSESMRVMQARMRVKIPKLDFANTELKDVLQSLRKISRANIFADWSALAEVGLTGATKISVRLADVSLARALGLIVRDLDKGKQRVRCMAVDDMIVVSTRVKLASRAGDMIEDMAERAVFTAQADPATRQKLALRLPRLDFPKVPLGTVVQFLREISGISIYVDWRALAEADVTKSTEVSLNVTDVSLDRALNLILQDVDKGKRLIGYTVVGGCIVISTRKQLPEIVKGLVADAALAARADPAMAKKLAQRLPKLDFAGIPLERVFQFLREVGNVNPFIDRRALAKAGVTKKTEVSLHLVNTSLGRALGFVLADADKAEQPLGYMAVGGCLVVSTRAELAKLSRLPADLMPPKPTGQGDLAVWKKLAVELPKLVFIASKLSDVVQFLGEAGGVPIEVDWAALEKLGIEKTSPVTVYLSKVSLATGLQFVLLDAGGMGKLACSIRGGKILISKAGPTRASAPPNRTRPAGTPPATNPGAPEKLLRKADLYRHNKMAPQAAAIYKEIIEKYPKTEAAATARKHLDAMGPAPKRR